MLIDSFARSLCRCALTGRSTRTRCGKGQHSAVGNPAPCGPLPQRAGHLDVSLPGTDVADYYSLSLPVAALPYDDEPSPFKALPASPLRLRKYVERFALHFKREMRFDFPQFEASETPDKPYFVRWEAFLFHVTADDFWQGEGPVKRRFIGGSCCRWREWRMPPKPGRWTGFGFTPISDLVATFAKHGQHSGRSTALFISRDRFRRPWRSS